MPQAVKIAEVKDKAPPVLMDPSAWLNPLKMGESLSFDILIPVSFRVKRIFKLGFKIDVPILGGSFFNC